MVKWHFLLKVWHSNNGCGAYSLEWAHYFGVNLLPLYQLEKYQKYYRMSYIYVKKPFSRSTLFRVIRGEFYNLSLPRSLLSCCGQSNLEKVVWWFTAAGLSCWKIVTFVWCRWGRGHPEEYTEAINLGEEKFDVDLEKKPRSGQILWIRGLTRLQTQVCMRTLIPFPFIYV